MVWLAGALPCLGAEVLAWTRLGPEGGMVVSLGASADGTVYLGAQDGHVFAREFGGNGGRWELRGRVGTRTDAVVARLLCDPKVTGHVYAAVWFQETKAGGGVFETRDGGRSWKSIGLAGEAVRALELAPSDSEEIVAGTRAGAFRSKDGGKSWERITPEGDEELKNVDSVAIDPRDAARIYVGTYHLPWKTTDGGKNWVVSSAGLIDDSDIMSFRVDVRNPEQLFLSACSGIYRSEDAGGTWTKLQGIPYASRRTQTIVQDAALPSVLYAGTTEGLWVTRDGGEGWRRASPKEWVINAVVVMKGLLILGTDEQGVLLSRDAGETFAAANEGFDHAVTKAIAGDPKDGRHALAVLPQGMPRLAETRDAGASWEALTDADGGAAGGLKLEAGKVEQVLAAGGTWLARTEQGQVWRWDAAKRNWSAWKIALATPATKRTTPGAKKRPEAGTPRSAAPVVKEMASGGEDVWLLTAEATLRCSTEGACRRSRAFGADSRSLAATPDGAVVVVLASGKIGVSTDRGETAVWTDLPVGDARALWVDVAKAGEQILVGTSSGLQRSMDRGTHWSKVGGGLPSGYMQQHVMGAERWIVTVAGGGLYASRDAGESWSRWDTDEVRGTYSGLVEVGRGEWVAGSKSEGLLRAETKQ